MNVPKRSEEVDKTDLQVIVNPEMGVPNVSTTSMQRFLKNSFKEQILLSLHPRTRIQILVQILHSDGSLLSSCFNAISMALLDAGIPLRSHLVSVDFILSKDNSLTIDPNCEQEKNSNTVASMSFQVSLEGKAVSELVHTIYATQEENQKKYNSVCTSREVLGCKATCIESCCIITSFCAYYNNFKVFI